MQNTEALPTQSEQYQLFVKPLIQGETTNIYNNTDAEFKKSVSLQQFNGIATKLSQDLGQDFNIKLVDSIAFNQVATSPAFLQFYYLVNNEITNLTKLIVVEVDSTSQKLIHFSVVTNNPESPVAPTSSI